MDVLPLGCHYIGPLQTVGYEDTRHLRPCCSQPAPKAALATPAC